MLHGLRIRGSTVRFAVATLLATSVLAMFVLATFVLASCSSTTSTPETAGGPTPLPSPATRVTLNVSAAASLNASFTALAAAFERANPEVNVVLNFAGSSTLAAQIRNGAPADVFASADTANMDKLVQDHLIVGTPVPFARNTLMIVVGKGNPLSVRGLDDLARDDVLVGLGAVGVPAGDYARRILSKANVDITPKTLESSVSAIVTKVALGEIDAGIVYVTDVAVDDDRVDGVAIPDDVNLVASYPIGVVSDRARNDTAETFIAFVRSAEGQAILETHKFIPLP